MDKMDEHDSVLLALREGLRAEALRLGFARAGFTTADPLPEVQQRRWERWRAQDKAGVMHYLLRESPRRTHPRDLLPEAQSALVVLAGYYDGDHPAPPEDEGAAGKIARYAWGRDYHLELREKLNALGEWTQQQCGMRNAECGINQARSAECGARSEGTGNQNIQSAIRNPQSAIQDAGETPAPQSAMDSPHSALRAPRFSQSAIRNPQSAILFRACVDSAPLDERALALRAGLGFIGKNTLLLDPEHGSWCVIGVLLLSLPLPPDPPLRAPGLHGCGSCRRCLEACPTGALEDAWRMDPRRCLSYLTIEQKDEIPPELNEKRRGWVFGCDLCQEVCPFNRAPLLRQLPGLAATQGAGPWLTERRLAATPTGKGFLRAWSHTPLARPGLKPLLRNLQRLNSGAGMDPVDRVDPVDQVDKVDQVDGHRRT